MGTSPQQLLQNSSSTYPYCTPQNYRFIGSRQEPCSPLPPPLAQLSLCTELPLLCWLRWRRIFFYNNKKKGKKKSKRTIPCSGFVFTAYYVTVYSAILLLPCLRMYYIVSVLFLSGVPAWRLIMQVYSITVGFSPTLCC